MNAVIFNARPSQILFKGILILICILLMVFIVDHLLYDGSGRTKEAKITAARAQLATITKALNAYMADLHRYPTTFEDLDPLVACPANSAPSAWHGPYLEKIPVDPWGNPFIYTCPGKRNPQAFDLVSAGEDGQVYTPDDLFNDREH